MNDPHLELRRLVSEADDLPSGPLKVELLEQAAHLADSMNEVLLGFKVRKLLMGAALKGGRPEQMTAAFTWCVAQSDRDPDTIPPDQILWQYRWVISELPHFAEVPRKQIDDTIQDMIHRYRAAGSTLRPVHLLRMVTSVRLGDVAMGTAAHQDWVRAGRDELSDSPRQEQNLLANFLAFAGRRDELFAVSKSVLDGRVDEPGFFGEDSSELLIPLLELGRVADAIRVQRSGYRYLARKEGYLHHLSFHVEFFARIDNWTGAGKVFEDHAAMALATRQYCDRFRYLRAGLILSERLQQAGETSFKFKLPTDLPIQPRGRAYDLRELSDWIRKDISGYAQRFDARNGTAYYMQLLRNIGAIVTAPTAK